ncbi:hypothetical protein BBJ28_00026575, partial [Nothophytophthora sp. Chile5]
MPLLLASRWLAVVAALSLASGGSDAAARQAVAIHRASDCSDAPVTLKIKNSSSCAVKTCRPLAFANSTYYSSTDCFDSDRHSYVSTAFPTDNYVMFDTYREKNCSLESYYGTRAVLASAECVPFMIAGVTDNANYSAIALVLKDRSTNIQYFTNLNCASQPKSAATASARTVATHSCYWRSHWYAGVSSPQTLSDAAAGNASASASTSSPPSDNGTVVAPLEVSDGSSGSSSGSGLRLHGAELLGTVVACVALTLGFVAFVLSRWRVKKKQQLQRGSQCIQTDSSIAMMEPDDHVYQAKPPSTRQFQPQSSSTCTTIYEQTTSRSLAPVLSSI